MATADVVTPTNGSPNLLLYTLQGPFSITPSALVLLEGSSSAAIVVRLTAPPAAAVEVSVASQDTSEFIVLNSSLVFTAQTWDIPQTIIIAPLDDAVQDSTVVSKVVFTFRSDDVDFNSVAYVMVSTVDSDLCQTCGDSLAEPITITSLPVQLEGSTVGFSNHHFIGCTAGYALPPTLFNRHTMP